MSRLTDNDRNFGPVTYGRSKWNALRLAWSSGGEDDGLPYNHFTAYIGGWVFRFRVLNVIRPLKIKHDADWDEATVKRLGRNWYYEVWPREYGFCLCDGHFSVYHGAQTHDGDTTKCWSCFLPWTQWRHVRTSLYGLSGEHFWTEPRNSRGMDAFRETMTMTDLCPSVRFSFFDYDGRKIIATTHIEEREWLFGTGWFKWLSWFRRPKVRRSLDLKFSEEVGPEKGSWKGGTIGHGIDMLPGELHEAAFRRYCDMEHKQKGQVFKLKFGEAERP